MTNTDVYAILFFILLLALGGLFLAINQVLLVRKIAGLEEIVKTLTEDSLARILRNQDAWDSEEAR